MKLRALGSLFAYRRLVRALDGIETALQQQNALLTRLADHFSPQFPVGEAPSDSVSFTRDDDMMLALDFVSRTQRDTGYTPSDDEVIQFLADERTKDLQERLAERDAELGRLGGRL